jgi:hypothetical protein
VEEVEEIEDTVRRLEQKVTGVLIKRERYKLTGCEGKERGGLR